MVYILCCCCCCCLSSSSSSSSAPMKSCVLGSGDCEGVPRRSGDWEKCEGGGGGRGDGETVGFGGGGGAEVVGESVKE